MPASSLLLIAVLAMPVQDAAVSTTTPQEAPAVSLTTPSALEADGESVLPLDVAGSDLRPADFVAARVRSILRDADDSQAWDELAQGLPELALSGGADLMSTFEAAALAESLRPAGATGISSPDVPPMSAPILVDWRSTTPFQAIALAVLLAAALAGLFRTWKRRGNRSARSGWGRRRRSRSGSGSRSGRGASPVMTPVAQARQLASAGITVPEIAQRTGMARDAVSILIGIQAR